MTAEESFEKFFNSFPRYGTRLATDWKEEIIKIAENYAIEFAKFHVEAALKAASEVYIKVEKKSQYGKYRKWQKVKEGEEVDLFNYQMQYSQDKKSILNAYPLDNIK